MTNSFNYDSFSHGQIISKKWLCEKLEPFLDRHDEIAILGSWYNVLGFMLKVRGNDQHITGIDQDPQAVEIAKKITDCWQLHGQIDNIVNKADSSGLYRFSVIINTSCEHMQSSWYEKVAPMTLLCLQSSNITIMDEPWYVTNPSSNIKEFIDKYPMSNYLFSDSISIEYDTWNYQRFMIIGRK